MACLVQESDSILQGNAPERAVQAVMETVGPVTLSVLVIDLLSLSLSLLYVLIVSMRHVSRLVLRKYLNFCATFHQVDHVEASNSIMDHNEQLRIVFSLRLCTALCVRSYIVNEVVYLLYCLFFTTTSTCALA